MITKVMRSLVFGYLFFIYIDALRSVKLSKNRCGAHFGKQILVKTENGVIGRPLKLKCRIKNWNDQLCGNKRRNLRWFFNDHEIKKRQYYQGLKVKDNRLTIAMFKRTNIGIYQCVLPNGKNRTFIVNAHHDPQSFRIRDLLPQDPKDEQANWVYWLPYMLNAREQYIARNGDEMKDLFQCHFYVSSNKRAFPKIRWTFSQLVTEEIINLYPLTDYKGIQGRMKIQTKELHCGGVMAANAWRKLLPKGRCFITKLSFLRLHDDDFGRYTCNIGGGSLSPNHQLSMNFTINGELRPHDIIRDVKSIEAVKNKNEGMIRRGSLEFDGNREVCPGSNVTLKCKSIPADERLYIFKRVLDPSKVDYSLRLIAESEKPKNFTLFDPGDKIAMASVKYSYDGKVEHTIQGVTREDAGVYQCNNDKAQYANRYLERTMELIVRDCYPSPSQSNQKVLHSQVHFAIIVTLLMIFVVCVIIIICCCNRYRRLKNTYEHRCVVVVQPSANAAYPSFLHRCNSSNNIDSLRSSNTDSCGSSCLTPSSTLDSTTSPFNSSLLTPLRPPDVRIQPMRRTRRFTRATSFSSGSTRWIRSRSNNLTYELPDQQQWELPRHSLTIGVEIGEGAFGVVKRGQLLYPDSQSPTRVAVKMLKEDFTEEELMDLIKEIEVMKLLDPHPHIIRLLGVCTRNGPLCLVNEYAPYGNLRDFLRLRRPKANETNEERLARISLPRGLLTYQHLIDFGLQVASGLEYLSARSVVHRDIAARNVLVGEMFEAKIADFGMSRHVVNYYRKTTEGRLPVKWLAPEALFDYVFTREGDVWSFGILLWEIFSLGGTPYPSIPVERLFGLLRQGYRNEPPFYAFPQINDIMRRCWSDQPALRPRFAELHQQLEQMRGVEEYTQILRESPYCDLAVSPAYIPMEA